MSVRLIGITQPCVDDVGSPAEMLAYCARVSSSANQTNHATGPKLIRSLIRRQEWSPLEMVSLTMEIETTRDIARQILRHRSFSFQEFSQRYAVVESVSAIREARMQHPTDRQASVATDNAVLAAAWTEAQRRVADEAERAYQWAIQAGIAKEQARAVLPEGMTMSRLYVAGTLRSWWHYVELRSAAGTQAEHREIAKAAKAIIVDRFPQFGEPT